jgi:Lon-like ATP-dependent protease
MVTIIPVDTIDEVLKHALVPENMDGFLSKLKKMAVRSTSVFADAPANNTTTA